MNRRIVTLSEVLYLSAAVFGLSLAILLVGGAGCSTDMTATSSPAAAPCDAGVHPDATERTDVHHGAPSCAELLGPTETIATMGCGGGVALCLRHDLVAGTFTRLVGCAVGEFTCVAPDCGGFACGDNVDTRACPGARDGGRR